MDLSELRRLSDEVKFDPLGVGYSQLDHAEQSRIVNTLERIVPNESEIPASTLFNLIDHQELVTVSGVANSPKYNMLSLVLSLPGVTPISENLDKAFKFVFGNNSKTLANVDKIKTRKGTRREELRLPPTTPSDIANAWKLP